MPTVIYGLIDPRTGECRYVGKTIQSPEYRLKQHIQDARRRPGEIARFRWINALVAIGAAPSVIVLEECGEDWQKAERRWVAKYRADGIKLLNGTDGGDGIHGHRHSQSTLERMSASAKTRYSEPAGMEHLAEMTRKAHLPESLAKLSISNRASFAKPEVKARLSAAQKLNCARAELREARSRVHKGKKVSAETREKLRQAALGRVMSVETIAKRVATITGRKHKPETIEKMRLAAKRRYAKGAEHDDIWITAHGN